MVSAGNSAIRQQSIQGRVSSPVGADSTERLTRSVRQACAQQLLAGLITAP
jgi:hypothetical protein